MQGRCLCYKIPAGTPSVTNWGSDREKLKINNVMHDPNCSDCRSNLPDKRLVFNLTVHRPNAILLQIVTLTY